jgi:hypothetical protein
MPSAEADHLAHAIISSVPWGEMLGENMRYLDRYVAHGRREGALYRLVLLKHPEYIPSGYTIDDMDAAAQTHDLGKLKVTGGDYTLWDRSVLSEDDRAKIRCHPRATEGILYDARKQGIPVTDVAIEIARSHHERINGEGYPTGTKEILPFVRLFSVVDLVVAMSEGPDVRPYRERGMTLPEIYVDLAGAVKKGLITREDLNRVFEVLRTNQHMEIQELRYLGPWEETTTPP